MGSRPERRRILFIDKPLQHRIIRSVSWPLVLVIVVAVAMQWQLASYLQQEAARSGTPMLGIPQMLFATAAFFVYAVACQLLVAVRLSHRIAGASYRIRETIKAARAGDSEIRAKLRDGDYLGDLAEEVNHLLEANAAATSSSAQPSAARPQLPDQTTRSEKREVAAS